MMILSSERDLNDCFDFYSVVADSEVLCNGAFDKSAWTVVVKNSDEYRSVWRNKIKKLIREISLFRGYKN